MAPAFGDAPPTGLNIGSVASSASCTQQISGGAPYRGPAMDRVTLPWHQHPRNSSSYQQNPHQRQQTSNSGVSPHHLKADEPIRPFFLASYHTPSLGEVAKRDLQLDELIPSIATIRLLGYEPQPNTPLIYGSGRESNAPETLAPSLTYFHHFTDPNERLTALIGTAHQIVNQLEWCLGEEYRSEEIEEWKREVYEGGRKVLQALAHLHARMWCLQG